MSKTQQNILKKGTTLIEVLVALFVFSVMAMTFYEAFALGIFRIVDAQKRLQAMGLATEQMEKIRNLAYEDVGFEGGVPSCVTYCVLNSEEERTLENVTFHILTGIQYEDDPMDGTLAAHTDTVPTDYKRVAVRVEWGDRSDSHRVEMTSRFVPPGMEQNIPNTGALSINVSNYAAQAVADARVEISGIVGNFFTDDTGNLFLLGIPVNTNGYAIRITKSGYETLTTLPYPPTGTFPPRNAPVSVANGTINVGNFELNPLTKLSIRFEDPFGNALPDIHFSMTGGRRLDNNYATAQYECMNEAQVSDEEGETDIENRSGGRYTFSLDADEETTYFLWKTGSPGDLPGSALIPYGGDAVEKVVFVRRDVPGIFVRVADSLGAVLSGATVHVTNTSLSYDESQTTDMFGFVYFPKTENALVSGATYSIHIEAEGYMTLETTAVPTNMQTVTATMTN